MSNPAPPPAGDDLFAAIDNAYLAEMAWQGPWTANMFPDWWPLMFQQQAANFHNVCNDPSLAQYYPALSHSDETDFNAWIASSRLYNIDYKSQWDPVPKCPEGWDCGGVDVTFLTKWDWNILVMGAYVALWLRLEDLWPGNSQKIWPYFMYMYDTTYGQLLVEEFIYDNPSMPVQCQLALRTNHHLDVQASYALLCQIDLRHAVSQLIGRGLTMRPQPGCMKGDDPVAVSACAAKQVFKMLPIQQTSLYARTGNPTWTPLQRAAAYQYLFSPAAATSPEQTQGYLKGYWEFYEQNDWMQPQKKGPPIVTPDPTHIAGKPNPTKDPAYQGDLPYAPPTTLPGQTVWHQKDNDPNAPKACIRHKGFIEEALPIVGGILGAIAGEMIMPGTRSKASASITLGVFAFTYLGQVYGWDALQNRMYGGGTQAETAATVVSVGAGVTAVLFLYDLNAMPKELDFGVGEDMIIAAALAEFTLEPTVRKVLSAGASVVGWLTAPLAFLERVVGMFSDGCVNSYLHGTCLCQNANVKGPLTESILTDVYGVTGKQHDLRTQCMRHQMLQGMWGNDPNQIGYCDPVYKVQNNPAACLDASVWTVDNIPTDDDLAYGMWQLISPCLDPANPVFMPPGPADSVCAQYGPYSRLIEGQCVNYGVVQ